MEPGFFADPNDLSRFLEGMRLARQLPRTEPLAWPGRSGALAGERQMSQSAHTMRRMYIRLAQGNVDPKRLDAYITDTRQRIAAAKEQTGLRHAYHAVNRELSRSVIIGIYDSEEQAPPAAGVNSESVQRLQREFGLQPEGIVGFEVIDQI